MPGVGRGVIKTVMRGTILTSQSWSVAVWVADQLGDFDPSQTELNDWNSDMQDIAHDAFNTIGGVLWPADTNYVGCTSYLYPDDSDVATMVSTEVDEPVTGSGTRQMPPQCALVMSHRSLTPGRSGRGRVYLPMGLGGAGNNGGIGTTPLGTVTDAWAAFLTAIKSIANTSLLDPIPVVASFTKTGIHEITRVVGDSKIDTQRRRENSVVANNSHEHSV